MNKVLLTLGILLFAMGAKGQEEEANYILGDLLVQVESSENIRDVIYELQMLNGVNTQLRLSKKVSEPMRIWLLQFDYEAINHQEMLDAVHFHPKVAVAQFNHKITYRNTPNDAQYSQQWQYNNTGQSNGTIGADIDADSAWDISTGGLTALGDTIVVCIIDGGIDLNHNDLTPNRWINYAEIPNNGIDDDNNGFIDDRLGWNTAGDNDNIGGSSHGTAVAGIIGAKGNNGIGVAGVNWDVKLMIVRGGTGQEAEVLEAYSYPLNLRKKYNETGGQEGAFVVATNASWGIDGGQASSVPLWCQMYDTLGFYGILNAGAGPNANTNVDVLGDLPTTCPSEYLMGVTNLNHNDTKVTQAGYGSTHIDLGAFGEGTFTTTNGGYSGFGGTSGATPHVTGSIALLYSAPCPSFAVLAKSNPAAAAALARDYIYNTVDPNASLNGITATGGRLNVYQAMQRLMDSCEVSGCLPPYSLLPSNVLDTSATISWSALTDTTTQFNLKYRTVGDTIWIVSADTLKTITLNNLMACTTYEVQVEVICDTTSISSKIITFRTDGCCAMPISLAGTTLSDTTAQVTWEAVLAANEYIIQYRKEGVTAWIEDTLSTNSSILSNLEMCNTYEFRVATVCDTGQTMFSGIVQFLSGCGNCTANSYCFARGNGEYEYIESVNLNGSTVVTGNNDGQYEHSGIITALDKTSYDLTITPGFVNNAFGENMAAWIDFNQDGDFDDAGEQIAQIMSSAVAATRNFTVPANAVVGITRMRVVLEYQSTPANCSNGIEGEVEDYCIEITNNFVCEVPNTVDTIEVGATNLNLTWTGNTIDSTYLIRFRPFQTTTWQYLTSSMTSMNISNLDVCRAYEVQIAAICNGGDTSAFSVTYTVQTDCTSDVSFILPSDIDLKIFPNPFSNHIQMTLDLPSRQNLEVQVFSVDGQLLQVQNLGELIGTQSIDLDFNGQPSGVYLVKIQT
ncbi:MAG: S8 family serine peptidase, partial [Saprospiraceae bacterium]